MAALDDLLRFPAYALVRQRGAAQAYLLGGSRDDLEHLADVPLEEGPPPPGRRFDRLLCVPFRQVRERGFEVHDDGTPLSAIVIEHEQTVPLDDLLAELHDEPVTAEGDGGFETSDEEYGRVVEAIIRDEIGNGEGANLVIGRTAPLSSGC